MNNEHVNMYKVYFKTTQMRRLKMSLLRTVRCYSLLAKSKRNLKVGENFKFGWKKLILLRYYNSQFIIGVGNFKRVHGIRGLIKTNRYFQISRYVCSIFSCFFCLYTYLVYTYIFWQYQKFWIASTVSRFLECSSIFYYSMELSKTKEKSFTVSKSLRISHYGNSLMLSLQSLHQLDRNNTNVNFLIKLLHEI